MKVTAQHNLESKTALQKAAELSPHEIRIRIQPGVYQKDNGNYLSWRDVSWTVIVESEREAQRFRSALAAFFVRLDRVGLDVVRMELEATNRGLTSSQVEELLKDKDESEIVSLTD